MAERSRLEALAVGELQAEHVRHVNAVSKLAGLPLIIITIIIIIIVIVVLTGTCIYFNLSM